MKAMHPAMSNFQKIHSQFVYCVMYIAQLAFIYFYAKRNYKWIDLSVKPDFDAVSQKNSVLVHQLSGMVFNMVYNFGAAILRAVGDTTKPLTYLLIAGALNVLLNVIFITVFNLDVAGVALATAISHALSCILVLRALMKRTDACKLIIKKIRIYKAPLMKILKVGLPAGLQSTLFSISVS